MKKKTKILLVEDDIITANAESFMISSYGYDIAVVNDSSSALEIIQSAREIDLVIIDIELQGKMDGIILAEKILKIIDIPIIFLTAHAEKAVIEKTKKIASYGYILKHTDENVIIASIDMALRLYRAKCRIKTQKREIVESETAHKTADRRYRQLFNSMIDGLSVQKMVYDNDYIPVNYRIIEVNPMFEKLTGISSEKAVGNLATDVFNSHTPPFIDIYKDVLKTNKPIVFEAFFDTLDKYFSVSAFAYDDSIFVTLLEDITIRKRIYTELGREREQLLSIFDSINSAIYVSDMDTYDILFANKFLKMEFNDDLVGATCYKVLQNKDKPCEFCTNDIIRKLDYKPYSWNFTNLKLGKEFQITDRMIKWPDGRDVRLEIAYDISELRETENALRKSEENYRVFLDNFIGIAYQAKLDSFVPDMFSGRVFEITGYSEEDFLEGRIAWDQIVHEDDLAVLLAGNQRLTENFGSVDNSVYRIVSKNGDVHWVFDISRSMLSADNNKVIQGSIYDISDKKRAEQEREKLQIQLNQSQKLESIGRLAGGLAHDYNNMLSIILGYSELILMNLNKSDNFYKEINEIFKAAKKSAMLTKQLLAFARKQSIEPSLTDINKLVSGMIDMLRRLINEDVDLIWKPGKDVWPIWIDPSQIDQILVNLVVNACDAITGSGTITIETHNIVIDETYLRTVPDAYPGDYVLMSLSDSGRGIEPHLLNNIFEPFFTTKPGDKGTGLGLATVYGIVKQNNGFINVYSEISRGTNFKIYLPRHEKDKKEIKKLDEHKNLTGTETILVVEDKSDILEIISSVLQKYGYNVLVTPSPDKALSIVKEYAGEIDMLVTDIVMPGMNGRDLLKTALKHKPGIKSLFMSGYGGDILADHGIDGRKAINFIQKPFSLITLVEKIRKILDS